MKFKDILEKAKGHGYTHYYDGGINATPIEEILEDWATPTRDNYTLAHTDEKKC